MSALGKRLVLVVCCLLCLPSQLMARDVWTWYTNDRGPMVRIDPTLLAELIQGNEVNIRLSEDEVHATVIDHVFDAINGDRSWAGSLLATDYRYTFVITLGKTTLHAAFTSPSGIYQYFGRKSQTGDFIGRLNRFDQITDYLPATDVVPPEESLLSNEGRQSSAATIDSINGDNFAIRQHTDELYMPVGSVLQIDLGFENLSNEVHRDLYVDIFFVLENTDLVALPPGCQILESTELKPVLSCDLGDFAPGESKSLTYRVRTGEKSHPLVYSTALVGGSRSDQIIELFRDVVTDTDLDGTSDFNELLAGTLPEDPASAPGDVVTIDVLALYPTSVSSSFGGEVDTRFNHLVNVTNSIFKESFTRIELRSVGAVEIDYTPASDLMVDLSRLTYKSGKGFSDVDRLRTLYGADLVVLLRHDGGDSALCGIANLGGRFTQGDFTAPYHKEYAYSVVNMNCHDDSVLAHEVGHNMGLVHSRREDPDGGTLSFSAGYGLDNEFATVMAFPGEYGVSNRLYRFSDRYGACGLYVCGVSKTDPVDGANAVASLNLVKRQIANYYPSMESRMKELLVSADGDKAGKAIIRGGLYSDQSWQFGGNFSNTSDVRAKITITPPEAYFGQKYAVYVVLNIPGEGFFQLNGDGDYETWEGSLDTLKAVMPIRSLNATQTLDISGNLASLEPGLLNKRISMFIAFRTLENGEYFYGYQPLTFTLTSN